MNILYLTTHLNVGGITSYLLTLAKGFKRRGHSIYVASSGGDSVTRFTAEGIIHQDIPIRTTSDLDVIRLAPSFLVLSRYIKDRDISLIHSNTRVTQVLGTWLSKYTGRPHVTTCHGFFKKRLSRRMWPCWGDRVIAISEQVKDHLIDDFHVSSSMIRLVHNGIDLERFTVPAPSPDEKHRLKEALQVPEGPVIGIISRLSDVKGHRYLIEATKHVLSRFPAVRLLVVGEGRELPFLVKLTERLRLSDHVIFIPQVQGTQKILSIMDIFVLPSLHEGLGLSLMEAMAAGIPCVGSSVGGIKTLIRNEQTGLLVKPQDAREISDAVIKLLLDPEFARKLGDNARTFVHKNFSQAEMLMHTEGVYRECLGIKG